MFSVQLWTGPHCKPGSTVHQMQFACVQSLPGFYSEFKNGRLDLYCLSQETYVSKINWCFNVCECVSFKCPDNCRKTTYIFINLFWCYFYYYIKCLLHDHEHVCFTWTSIKKTTAVAFKIKLLYFIFCLVINVIKKNQINLHCNLMSVCVYNSSYSGIIKNNKKHQLVSNKCINCQHANINK